VLVFERKGVLWGGGIYVCENIRRGGKKKNERSLFVI